MAKSTENTSFNIITCQLVSNDNRLNFLPDIDNQLFMLIENTIYDFASEHITNYTGGHWEFVELSNGGKFMYPSNDKKILLNNVMNYFSKEVKAVTAGLSITALAFGRLASRAHSKWDMESTVKFDSYFHKLKDYAISLDNQETMDFLRFID